MAAFINTQAIRAHTIDSRMLGVLGVTAHRMDKPGAYEAEVYRGKQRLGSFAVEVQDDARQTQATVDLAQLDIRAATTHVRLPAVKLRSEGYLVLHVSRGTGGFQVVITRGPLPGEDDAKPVETFNSLYLNPGDLFVATPIRPGFWRMAEGSTAGRSGALKVLYPDTSQKDFRADAVHEVAVGREGFQPAELTVNPGEAVTFKVEIERAQILLELAEPEDRGDDDGGDSTGPRDNKRRRFKRIKPVPVERPKVRPIRPFVGRRFR